MREAKFWLYVVEHRDSGTKYIGQTNRPTRRKSAHLNTPKNRHLRNAINKYGRNAFTFRIVSEHTREEIDQAEIDMIAACRDMGDRLYNVSEGGGRGDVEAANAVCWTNYFLDINQPTSEQRKERARKAKETIGPSGRREAAAKRLETLGPEGRAAITRKAKATLGPERRSAAAKKAIATKGPKVLRAAALKRVEKAGLARMAELAANARAAKQTLSFLGFRSNAEAAAWLSDYQARRFQSSPTKEPAHV